MSYSNEKDPQHWRSKYLDALEKFEKKEKKLSHTVEELKLGLSRISIAADGIDGQLDKALFGLRQSIREEVEPEKVHQQILIIGKIIKGLDEQKKKERQLFAQHFHRLLNPFESLPLSKSTIAALKKFRKKIKNKVSGNEGESVFNDYELLCEKILNEIQQKPGAPITKISESHQPIVDEAKTLSPLDDEPTDMPSKPFWQKWFKQKETVKCENSDDQPILESNSEVTEPEMLAATEPLPQFSKEGLLEIQHHLASLLLNIRLPVEFDIRISQLQAMVKSELDQEGLVELVEGITLVIMEGYQQDQEKFEKFLHLLDGRLKDIQSFLTHTKDYGDKSIEVGAKFNEEMKSEVNNLQADLGKCTTLESMSSLVNGRLNVIVDVMEQHRISEETRIKKATKQIERLERKLHETESKADELKSSLHKQQYKIHKDPLTGLPNREAYQERLTKSYNYWLERQNELSIAVGDIDYFKQINDSYGHLAGDKVLSKVGELLSASIRSTDFLARYGGEEFVFILENASLENVTQILEKLREKIEACEFHFRGIPVKVTMSFGLTFFAPNDTPEDAFHRADKALYDAKMAGRNRLCQRLKSL